ncbi:uncharacterized protein [Ptychodera flava]|uniref:uncharacterized protein n=1 Tax=Ptychodera flava TaxID=63121 RepID=UPI003969F94A
MLGTLEEHQKKDWKSYVGPLVHAYNCTTNDSTGYAPYYLMFGRHPRLPIDVYLGLEPEGDLPNTYGEYAQDLRDRLDCAYTIASKAAAKKSSYNKKRYDSRARGAVLEHGDRVLVKNVSIRGKHKIADRWERDVYVVVCKTNPDLPVYTVRPESGVGRERTLHHNLLLPCFSLPCPSENQRAEPKETVDYTRSTSKAEESQDHTLPESGNLTFARGSLARQIRVLDPYTRARLYTNARMFYSTMPFPGISP